MDIPCHNTISFIVGIRPILIDVDPDGYMSKEEIDEYISHGNRLISLSQSFHLARKGGRMDNIQSILE